MENVVFFFILDLIICITCCFLKMFFFCEVSALMAFISSHLFWFYELGSSSHFSKGRLWQKVDKWQGSVGICLRTTLNETKHRHTDHTQPGRSLRKCFVYLYSAVLLQSQPVKAVSWAVLTTASPWGTNRKILSRLPHQVDKMVKDRELLWWNMHKFSIQEIIFFIPCYTF